MALDPFLLEILVCPETKQNLALAPTAVLEQLNAAIAAGRALNRGGRRLHEALEAALLRQDNEVAYPVKDDIPVLLVDEQIAFRDLL